MLCGLTSSPNERGIRLRDREIGEKGNGERNKPWLAVPIRRTRWLSFFIGAATLILSTLLAAASSSLLLLLTIRTIDGTLLIILFAFLWSGFFFLSYPWQRRSVRAVESRRPGINLADDRLTVPIDAGITMQFSLSKPFELKFGWFDTQVVTVAAPTMHTRGVLTYAVLSQDDQQLFLKAEDSVRDAIAAGWLRSDKVTLVTPELRLWASDLVVLTELLRKH